MGDEHKTVTVGFMSDEYIAGVLKHSQELQAQLAAAESRAAEAEAAARETSSLVIRAAADLVRLAPPDWMSLGDPPREYVSRDAVVTIALRLKRDVDALRTRKRIGELK